MDFILLKKFSWLWKNWRKDTNFKTSQAKLLNSMGIIQSIVLITAYIHGMRSKKIVLKLFFLYWMLHRYFRIAVAILQRYSWPIQWWYLFFKYIKFYSFGQVGNKRPRVYCCKSSHTRARDYYKIQKINGWAYFWTNWTWYITQKKIRNLLISINCKWVYQQP